MAAKSNEEILSEILESVVASRSILNDLVARQRTSEQMIRDQADTLGKMMARSAAVVPAAAAGTSRTTSKPAPSSMLMISQRTLKSSKNGPVLNTSIVSGILEAIASLEFTQVPGQPQGTFYVGVLDAVVQVLVMALGSLDHGYGILPAAEIDPATGKEKEDEFTRARAEYQKNRIHENHFRVQLSQLIGYQAEKPPKPADIRKLLFIPFMDQSSGQITHAAMNLATLLQTADFSKHLYYLQAPAGKGTTTKIQIAQTFFGCALAARCPETTRNFLGWSCSADQRTKIEHLHIVGAPSVAAAAPDAPI